MGLSLSAVNKNYGFTKGGEDKKGNRKYASTNIGYFGFKFFRDSIIKWATNSNVESLEDLFKLVPDCYNDDITGKVAIKDCDFTDKELENEKVKKYLQDLDYIKRQFPNLYAVMPLIYHNDCEFEMPLDQIQEILPFIKKFRQHDNKNYGYSGWDYNFTEEFIKVLEKVVKNKGKLYFS